ncbi:MAG: 50S ribosomal protein L37 [Planctomycetota bacterium]|nr:MAG: 50S ribosomal protein L37 [Planctomycetota bacterium]REJ89757.1 MAG: 50S ribosomal protein L37 [Planctomycetota bacterium]REK26426.1 MAG: 50S ribosomal protein L37 [Planctomycetota bacterium]REK32095.1 MAG: 50S ribosomal protein L37 [Planctomycetota bacterium]
MTLSRPLRRVLLFTGCLIWLPVTGYGLGTGNLVLAFLIGLPLFLTSMYFSLKKLVCPNCGQAIRTVSVRISHCMKCGTPFESFDRGPQL